MQVFNARRRNHSASDWPEMEARIYGNVDR